MSLRFGARARFSNATKRLTSLHQQLRLATMATASTIQLHADAPAAFRVPNIQKEAAEKATQLLQRNHEQNDIIFNDAGFHNHIVHHILATFALGADVEALQRHYDLNAAYQRPPPKVKESLIQNLADPETFIKNMGPQRNYSSFRSFFEQEIEKKGMQEVLQEYVFKGDKRANTVFNRLFAGFLHPIIHLGYAIEFEQPAIAAEALGQACIHAGWQDVFFELTEQNVSQNTPRSDSLVNLIDRIHASDRLKSAVKFEDDNKIRDGLLARAKDDFIDVVSGWQVTPNNLEEAIAEMINACAYFTGAAQNPPKQIKFDFFLMHAINGSIFFSSFMKQPWISVENKAKLLEWKGRLDLALYASRGSPNLLLDEVTTYPSHGQLQSWDQIIKRAQVYDDDGHASKFVRALAHGEKVCAPFEQSEKLRVKGDMWRQLAMMVMDSVEDSGERWVRSAGFDEAWEGFKNRS